MENKIKVSILCTTYNQESYIAQAIESFINQKTQFDYEILIHDDASTDHTADIIREYEKKYPDLIKPIYQVENQYSKGVSIMEIQLTQAQGKYIAFCEGDDYWCDPNKIQTQYDILEAHPELDMVSHKVKCINDTTGKVEKYIDPISTEGILSPEQVIYGGGGYLGTNSLFFRKEVLWPTPSLRKILSLDYTTQILGSLRGGIYYIPKTMSVYRLFAKNSWSVSVRNNVQKAIDSYNRINDMLRFLDTDTEGIYHKVIEDTMRLNEFYILELKCDTRQMKTSKYKSIYRELPPVQKLKIHVKKNLKLIKNIKKSC